MFFDLAVNDWLQKLRARDPASWERQDNMFFWYLLCYCKPFSLDCDEGDSKNFYMEREWRTIGKVDFMPADIQKVVLPESYADRFEKTHPDFAVNCRVVRLAD